MWLGKWFGQDYAIKVLTASNPNSSNRETSSDSSQIGSLSNGTLTEFESEISRMVTLTHPNIVRVFGASIDRSEPLCIVEEYAAHGSLFDVLHNSSKINLEWWLRWRMAKQLVAALDYLHTLEPEIVHRNVKSSNVLIAQQWHIRICDVGMSKVRSETAQQSLKGTMKDVPVMKSSAVRWRAPETMGRTPEWSTKSDVYSVGMVIWELCARQIPFQDVVDDAAIPIMVRMEGERPEIPNGCPEVLMNIIRQCWKADPHERPSCADILGEMEDNDESFPEKPDTLPPL